MIRLGNGLQFVLRSAFLAAVLVTVVRTGRRNSKRSAQRAASTTAAHPFWHEPAFLDFLPGGKLLLRFHASEVR